VWASGAPEQCSCGNPCAALTRSIRRTAELSSSKLRPEVFEEHQGRWWVPGTAGSPAHDGQTGATEDRLLKRAIGAAELD